jgi:hypothetical protein
LRRGDWVYNVLCYRRNLFVGKKMEKGNRKGMENRMIEIVKLKRKVG